MAISAPVHDLPFPTIVPKGAYPRYVEPSVNEGRFATDGYDGEINPGIPLLHFLGDPSSNPAMTAVSTHNAVYESPISASTNPA